MEPKENFNINMGISPIYYSVFHVFSVFKTITITYTILDRSNQEKFPVEDNS